MPGLCYAKDVNNKSIVVNSIASLHKVTLLQFVYFLIDAILRRKNAFIAGGGLFAFPTWGTIKTAESKMLRRAVYCNRARRYRVVIDETKSRR